MIRSFSCAFASIILSLSQSAMAQESGKPKVAIETSAGRIVVELESRRAPITSENFLRYAREKRLDDTTFYRAMRVPNTNGWGIIQGGIQHFVRKALMPIAHEPTTKTGLSHIEGAISMARGRPGTAMGDFFIVVGSMTYMDAHPEKSGDNLGFAAFGHVVSGMDVVKKILAMPTLPKSGLGGMKGQMLAQPVRILTVRPFQDYAFSFGSPRSPARFPARSGR